MFGHRYRDERRETSILWAAIPSKPTLERCSRELEGRKREKHVVTRDSRLMIDARKGTEPGLQTCFPFGGSIRERDAMKKISDIIRFLRYDMWRRTLTENDSFLRRFGYGFVRTIVLVIRGFNSKSLNDKAKSLTYSMIFAVVPILAMVVAVAKGFGMVDVIENQSPPKAAYSSVSASSFCYGLFIRSSNRWRALSTRYGMCKTRAPFCVKRLPISPSSC